MEIGRRYHHQYLVAALTIRYQVQNLLFQKKKIRACLRSALIAKEAAAGAADIEGAASQRLVVE